jgi:hypothetical protein
MNYFTITIFAQDFLRAAFRIGAHNCCTTLVTYSVMEFVRVSVAHPIPVTLIRMTSRDGEVILDIEYEFLLDNFKWFFGYFTFNNANQEGVDIFLSCFVPNYFFVILVNRKCLVKRPNIGVFVFAIMPSKSSLFCFSF